MTNYFITGISTDVGKTIVAAIITQALDADYWKPIQSGSTQHTDRNEVQRLVSSNHTTFHNESYLLNTPMSPHQAASIDGITIALDQIRRPITDNRLVIEGAGGLLVPLNHQHTIIDLIQPQDKVILVSSGYLGSINHTLMSVELLKLKGLNCAGIIYNQVSLPGTIEVIESMTQVPTIAHLSSIDRLDATTIRQQADSIKHKILSI